MVALLTLAVTAACAGKEDGTTDSTAATTANAAGGSSCVVGTWTQSSPSYSPSFTFNADGTGEEKQSPGSGGTTVRFSWEAKGTDKIAIKYVAEGDVQSAAYDMPINCEAGTFGNMYKKG